MRHVPFDPPHGLDAAEKIWWAGWAKRAGEAKLAYDDAMALGKPAAFNGKIWSELKAWLLKHVFHGKCAYCEGHIVAQSFGDGEHFRPKGNVTVRKPPEPPKTRATKQKIDHPGYYWLAYDHRNLLPACGICNNSKSDQFPIEAATYSLNALFDPKALDDLEKPLLINPYREDPAKYLSFGDHGSLDAIDGNAKGIVTIEVFNLNRPELVDERWKRQMLSIGDFCDAFKDVFRTARPLKDALPHYIGDDAPYSAAVRGFLNAKLAQMGQNSL